MGSKRRIFIVLFTFSFLLTVFAVRMGWLAWSAAARPVTAGGRTINELAVRQREQGIELDSGRGHFVDRDGVRLTGQIQWLPTLFPVRDLPEEESLMKLAVLADMSLDELKTKWKMIQAPFALEIENKESSKPPIGELPVGVEWLPYMKRYPEGTSGNQWLGYVAQRPDVIRGLKIGQESGRPFPIQMQVGASGLELSMDRFLRGIGGTRVSYGTDGKYRSLPSIGTRIRTTDNPYYPIQVQTTIKEGIQRELEKLSQAMKVEEGAIVVLDARQGDIIAMVSSPFYDPNRIQIEAGAWSNRAVKAEAPGSIFKLVVAAAALESGATKPGEMFHCSGEYNRYGLSCWKAGGHGEISLEQGLAQSCNVVFAELGERLSQAQIARTASGLGLSRKIGWHADSFMGGEELRQIDQEEAGRVFHPTAAVDGGVLAQTALGQRDVLVTPLQAANLVVTLLHDGQLFSPRLVSKVKYKDGSTMADFPVKKSGRAPGISPKTSHQLLVMMRRVVTEGTGRSMRSSKWELAGKSGTAQVMKLTKKLNQQWFIGYGPVSRPQYAVAVLVQNRPAGSRHLATDVFRRVMDILAQDADMS